jgi:hypothetical protein
VGRTAAGVVVGVVEDRIGETTRAFAARRRVLVLDQALATVPAVVGAGTADDARRGAESVVDLLTLALADVGDDQVAALAVEREAPWVAQAVGKDLVPAGRADEGVVRIGSRISAPPPLASGRKAST